MVEEGERTTGSQDHRVIGKQTFEDLEVWKRGCRLAVDVYSAVSASKDFALKDQMQRCGVSVPSNIAEGYERSPKEFIRFLRIAKGSIAELRTQTYIALRIKMIPQSAADPIITECIEMSKMLQSLINNRSEKLNAS